MQKTYIILKYLFVKFREKKEGAKYIIVVLLIYFFEDKWVIMIKDRFIGLGQKIVAKKGGRDHQVF